MCIFYHTHRFILMIFIGMCTSSRDCMPSKAHVLKSRGILNQVYLQRPQISDELATQLLRYALHSEVTNSRLMFQSRLGRCRRKANINVRQHFDINIYPIASGRNAEINFVNCVYVQVKPHSKVRHLGVFNARNSDWYSLLRQINIRGIARYRIFSYILSIRT